jgi:hypothetical protein
VLEAQVVREEVSPSYLFFYCKVSISRFLSSCCLITGNIVVCWCEIERTIRANSSDDCTLFLIAVVAIPSHSKPKCNGENRREKVYGMKEFLVYE